MKERRVDIHIRVPKDVKDYIDLAATYHGISNTDFMIKQCLRKDFVCVDFSDLKQTNNIFSSIGNNVNQIARSLNILVNSQDKLSQEQFDYIQKEMESIQAIFFQHKELLDNLVVDSYKMIKKTKIREIEESLLKGGSSATYS